LSFAPRSEPPFYIIAAVGSWLSKVQRDDFVIATKFGLPAGPGSNDVGGSRKHIIRAVEQSLERLGTHYIDLYQIHSWDSGALLKETLLTLHDLVRIGKVRYTGCSNYKGFQIQKSVDLSQQLNIEGMQLLT
jgi:aryl-alcohol dehydrogenase-like predicted oxidoreductase